MNESSLVRKLDTIVTAFATERNRQAQYQHYIAYTEQELNQIITEPPAMAYVIETGDLYFLHGPEFWFGLVGTAEKRWNDREPNRWVRITYSGKRAIIQSTDISKVSAQALSTLYQMMQINPIDFVPNDYGSGYWSAIENAYKAFINTTFVELNTCTCETIGTKLYDIEEGDIVVEDGARFVQARSKKLDEDPIRFKYPFNLLSTKAMIEGTPGLHLHYATSPRPNFMSIHPERMCYVVTSKDHPKGAQTLQVSVYPASVPAPTYGVGPKQWKVNETTTTHNWAAWPGWGPQSWPLTRLSVNPPTGADPGEWYVNKFCFINFPITYAPLKVTDFSYTQRGASYPNGTKVSFTLEQGYPSPVITALSAFCIDDQPYWDAVAPVRNSFTIHTTGSFGGGINATAFNGYIRPRSTSGRLGAALSSNPWIDAGKYVDLYNPVSGNWGGMKGHSVLRGLSKDDYLRMPESNVMYKVVTVNKNELENPNGITFSTKTHYLVLPFTNVYGTEIGGYIHHYPNIVLDPHATGYRGDLYVLPYCPWTPPTGDTAGIPIIIQSISKGTVTLTAPIPCSLPKGTRLNIYASQDTDLTLYSYYDYYEYAYKLAKYNKVHYEMSNVGEAYNRLNLLYLKAKNYKKIAEQMAGADWYTPPYFELKTLKSYKWHSDFDHFGDTYPEVLAALQVRMGILTALNATSIPSVIQTEVMSILDYGKS
jgi:hypothetical protein